MSSGSGAKGLFLLEGISTYPCVAGTRLGITAERLESADLKGLSGLHFHTLCEQDTNDLEKTLAACDEKSGHLPRSDQFTYLNMGGGHWITKPLYRSRSTDPPGPGNQGERSHRRLARTRRGHRHPYRATSRHGDGCLSGGFRFIMRRQANGHLEIKALDLPWIAYHAKKTLGGQPIEFELTQTGIRFRSAVRLSKIGGKLMI